MQLVDTHTHLDMPQFSIDRKATIERAHAAGVAWMIDVGADLPSSRRAVALAQQEPTLWAAVGVHPHDAETVTAAALAELRTLAAQPRVVAIGEIGLDYYRDLAPRPAQRAAFAAQLALAQELGLPVIIHNRDAHEDTLALLREALGGRLGALSGVMHCFSGGPELAQQVLDLGLYLGLDGPLTYPNARALPEVARLAPLERLLIETDCPYLAPQGHRGQRNEPAYVRLVAERLAELRGLTLAEVSRATTTNAGALFGVNMPSICSVRCKQDGAS